MATNQPKAPPPIANGGKSPPAKAPAPKRREASQEEDGSTGPGARVMVDIPIATLEAYQSGDPDKPITLLTIVPGASTVFTVSALDYAAVVASVSLAGFTGAWAALNGVQTVVKSGGDTLTVAIDSTAFGAAPAPATITAKAVGAGTLVDKVRASGAAADIGRLTDGQDVTFTITAGGPVPELDGQTFPVEQLEADNFSVTCTVATALAGVTATIAFDETTAPPPGQGLPITQMKQVFVHHYNVALAKNQVGYLFASEADAATMIADGDAVDAYETTMAGPYISASDPWPPTPPAPPAPAPSPPAGPAPTPPAPSTPTPKLGATPEASRAQPGASKPAAATKS